MSSSGSEKVASEPAWHEKFSSRFVIHAKEVSHRRLLTCMCTFAAAAECFNTVVMPSHSLRGYDLTTTSCNLLGAWLCGIALRLCDLGSKMSTLSDVFRGGFVSCFTSFCFMVEESATLFCAKNPRALQFFVLCMLLGPFCFHLGCRTGDVFVQPTSWVRKRLEDTKEHHDETTKAVLTRARNYMASWVVIAIAIEGQRNGSGAAGELAIGVMCSMAAVAVGDAVGVLAQAVMDFDSDVNWGTIIANVAALLILSVTQLCRPHSPHPGWFLSVLCAKICSSFCGTLSGYGAYSEDVGGQLSEGKVDIAAANMGMNVLVGIVFVAILDYVSCGSA